MNVFVLLGLAWLVFLGKATFSYFSRRSGPSLTSLFGSPQRRGGPTPPVGQSYGAQSYGSQSYGAKPYGVSAPGHYRSSFGSVSRSNVRRRRDVLVALVGLCVASLLPAVLVGGSFLVLVHVIADTMLLVYVAALVQLKNRRQPRAVAQPVTVARVAQHRYDDFGR